MIETPLSLPPELRAALLGFVVAAVEAALRGRSPPSLLATPQRT